ncbi:hypothetical protein [Domibacillus mangrovi]|uniref:hypothetical protein n=1 Tax=Domibacillus mangrovi TaxID=1714354 RepID=UPI000A6A738A|nr:hypothetical protein [Domibacillus mangrovi]
MGTGHIAFLTHYWCDEQFPYYRTVTKVGCIYPALTGSKTPASSRRKEKEDKRNAD